MRSPLLVSTLLSTLLSACASAPQSSDNTTLGSLKCMITFSCPPTAQATGPVAQTGPLKVHPGLLGQPVPPELQNPDGSPVAKVTAPGAEPAQAMKLDAAGLRAQRSVYFDLDSAEIKSDANLMLQAHAQHLASHPGAKVRVEGNADERGSADYNKRLGLKRAEAVKQSLLNNGTPEKQVRVVSLGESKPKMKGHNEESWAENRRADVVYEKED